MNNPILLAAIRSTIRSKHLTQVTQLFWIQFYQDKGKHTILYDCTLMNRRLEPLSLIEFFGFNFKNFFFNVSIPSDFGKAIWFSKVLSDFDSSEFWQLLTAIGHWQHLGIDLNRFN